MTHADIVAYLRSAIRDPRGWYDLDDAASDVLLAFTRTRSEDKYPPHLLKLFATRKAHERMAAAYRKTTLRLDDFDHPVAEPPPSECDAILYHLDRFSDVRQKVALLYWIGVSRREIAERLGMHRRTVRRYLGEVQWPLA